MFHSHHCFLAVLGRIYLISDIAVLCIYVKEFVLCDKASVDLYFTLYLRMLSVAQAIWHQAIE
jgi:hypothetical protein